MLCEVTRIYRAVTIQMCKVGTLNVQYSLVQYKCSELLKFSAAFHKACISKRVAPKHIVARIEQSRTRHSAEMERAFITDDAEKLIEQSRKLRTVYQSYWWAALEFLTLFDKIRFCRYLALLHGRTESKSKSKNECLLHSDETVSAMLSVILQGIF